MGKMTTDEANVMAKKAAKAAVMEMHMSSEDDFDDVHNDVDFSEDIDTTRPDKTIGFDVFEDIGAKRVEAGDYVSYVIKRNGMHIATKNHPYDWELVRRDFGAGQYQVICKGSNGKYVKSETRMLGMAEAFDKRLEDTEEKHQHKEGATKADFTMMDFLTLMQTQQAQARQEAREMANQQSQTMAAVIGAMAQMFQANKPADTNGNVQLEMMRMQQEFNQRMMDQQNKIFERITENQAKLFEKVDSNKEKGLGWADILKMTEESRNSGLEMATKFYELAEEKASEKTELLEELKESIQTREESPKSKSMTDTLIETTLPLIASALAQNQAGALGGGQLPRATPRPAPRGALRPVIAGANRQVQPRGQGQRTAPQAAAKANFTAKAKDHAENNGFSGGLGETHSEAPLASLTPVQGGMPTLNLDEVVDLHEATSSLGELRSSSLQVEAKATVNIHAVSSNEVKETCMGFLPELLGGLMVEAKPPTEASIVVIESLKQNGISVEEFSANVLADDLVDVARQYQLPEIAHDWLRDVYKEVTTSNLN